MLITLTFFYGIKYKNIKINFSIFEANPKPFNETVNYGYSILYYGI